MIPLLSTPQFERAYRKFVRRFPFLQSQIDEVLKQMENDINMASLHTHKLSGKLKGLSAGSCGYDCRIVFSIEKETATGKEFII